MVDLTTKRLLSVEEVALTLDIAPRTVSNEIAAGSLRAERVGRRTWVILREDLEEYQRNKAQEAAADEVADEAQDS